VYALLKSKSAWEITTVIHDSHQQLNIYATKGPYVKLYNVERLYIRPLFTDIQKHCHCIADQFN